MGELESKLVTRIQGEQVEKFKRKNTNVRYIEGIYNIFRLPLPCYTSDYHHLYKTRLLLLMVDMLVADFVTMTHLRHVFNYLNCSLHPQIFFFDFPVNKV